MSENPHHERRRGFRFPTDQIEVCFTSGGKPPIKIIDLSTLGMAIATESEPNEETAQFRFSTPESLAGLVIDAKKRHSEKITGAEPSFRTGYEFQFKDSEQHNRLHRWTTEALSLNAPVTNKEPESEEHLQSSAELARKLEIRFPKNYEEYEYCLNEAAPLRVQHALIQSKFFSATTQQGILAFMSFLPELKDFKLYDGTRHSEALAPLRAKGLKIAEVSLPYFNENLLKEGIESTADLRKLQLMYSIFPHIILYAKRYAQSDILVSLLPSYLQEFFRLWLFEEVAPDKNSERDEHLPKLMILKLSDFFRDAPEKRPELVQAIHTLEESGLAQQNFTSAFYPERTEFLEFFGDKHALVNSLTEDQKTYFKFLEF